MRLKSQIKTIEDALTKIKGLRGATYIKDGQNSIGLIAQEVATVLPEVVIQNNDGYLSVAYGNIVSVLIEAVKELSAKVEELERSK
jgi:chorismate mutase